MAGGTSPGPSGKRAMASVLGALAIAVATARGRGRGLDDRAFRLVNSEIAVPATDAFFRGVTELGSLWAAIAAAATLAAGGRRRAAVDALGAALATWLAGQGLKRLFRRLRPYEVEGHAHRLLIARPAGASWPSSHPAVLLTFVEVAARDLSLPAGALASLAALVGAVGVSRVALGVHYPADVAGGLLMGHAVAEAWGAAVSPKVLG